MTRLAHELRGCVLPREELVEVLEVVLGEHPGKHLRGGTDVHNPVGFVREGVRLELRVHRVRGTVHLATYEQGCEGEGRTVRYCCPPTIRTKRGETTSNLLALLALVLQYYCLYRLYSCRYNSYDQMPEI